MAEAARRAGVSPAAPYRHFATRDALPAATADLLARELHDAAARDAHARPEGPAAEDSAGALAAAASTYTRFVIRHGAGFDVIFADELRHMDDPAGRTR